MLLKKTEKEYGPAKIVPAYRMNQFRVLDGLKSGKLLDIIASTSSLEREQEFRVIRHSIHKDLMGIRLLLIKKEREAESANIKNLTELKELIAGQGSDWTRMSPSSEQMDLRLTREKTTKASSACCR